MTDSLAFSSDEFYRTELHCKKTKLSLIARFLHSRFLIFGRILDPVFRPLSSCEAASMGPASRSSSPWLFANFSSHFRDSLWRIWAKLGHDCPVYVLTCVCVCVCMHQCVNTVIFNDLSTHQHQAVLAGCILNTLKATGKAT